MVFIGVSFPRTCWISDAVSSRVRFSNWLVSHCTFSFIFLLLAYVLPFHFHPNKFRSPFSARVSFLESAPWVDLQLPRQLESITFKIGVLTLLKSLTHRRCHQRVHSIAFAWTWCIKPIPIVKRYCLYIRGSGSRTEPSFRSHGFESTINSVHSLVDWDVNIHVLNLS